jgi:hypothetical protein
MVSENRPFTSTKGVGLSSTRDTAEIRYDLIRRAEDTARRVLTGALDTVTLERVHCGLLIVVNGRSDVRHLSFRPS